MKNWVWVNRSRVSYYSILITKNKVAEPRRIISPKRESEAYSRSSQTVSNRGKSDDLNLRQRFLWSWTDWRSWTVRAVKGRTIARRAIFAGKLTISLKIALALK